MACGLWLVASRASRGPSGKATARAQILILLENQSILPGRFKDAATPCLGNCIKTVFCFDSLLLDESPQILFENHLPRIKWQSVTKHNILNPRVLFETEKIYLSIQIMWDNAAAVCVPHIPECAYFVIHVLFIFPLFLVFDNNNGRG